MENIATIEERIEEEFDLEDCHGEINDEIEVLWTKMDWIEQQAIEEFNEHMDIVF